MALIPHPDQTSAFVRAIARAILPGYLRRSGVHGLQIAAQYQSFWTPRFRANMAELKRMKDCHKGQTCVIMGNGPSLADMDFSLLKNIPTFGLNRGYLLWQKREFTPTYYVAANDLVIEQFHCDITKIPCKKFLPLRWQSLFKGKSTSLFLPQLWSHKFCSDITRGVWSCGTVTFASMQIAYYMGFKKVVLIGVDHNYIFAGDPNKEIVADGPDPNHFDNSYFGKGTRWNLPDIELSEKAYGLARQAFEADGRQIINATRGGALEIFPRANFEAALALSCPSK
ncbi:MAG: hypothetical protein GXP05_12075 [Alphaproteobacteria bacterium]|nr:hypothetical protein [Alphaproteobacteria bacterium]